MALLSVRHVRSAVVAVALASALAGAAGAQETAPPPAAAEPAKPATAWVVNCSSGTTGTALECQITQNLTESKTGQRVLTLTVRRQLEGGYAMLVALPHGLYIPAGVIYQIDAGEKKTTAIQTSDQNGAYAVVPLDDPTIAALKGGTNLNVGMESLNRSPVVIPASLNGFTAAFDKIKAVN